jgi:DMATS type aromatic prenyltransferase
MGLPALTRTSGVSLGAIGKRKLRSLAAALDLSEELTAQAVDIFTLMSGAWGDWAAGYSPLWPNDISDDGTPFEFSASFDGGAPRLRMLVESQSERISRTSSWAAGIALGERLKAEGRADLSLFDLVRDLFVPHAGAQGRFLLWHAVVIEQGQPALFKAYVNPCPFGVGSAPHLVAQALNRLGFHDAWKFLEDRLASDPDATVRYFSVDLEDPERARVKVYLGCSRSAEAVDRLIEPAANRAPADAQRWLDTLTGSQGPFDSRPILNCFSFRRDGTAPDVTVHVPIRCYVKHDAEALERVSKLLTRTDADRLSRALSAVSERPLNVGRGLLTYASLRREASAVRVTVYLAPEAYSITSRRPSVPPASGSASGVHKTAPLTALVRTVHMADVQALIERQGELLVAQPLLGHLALVGSAEQAARVTGQLALLAVWLGDLFRFAQERTTEPLIRVQLAELARAHAVLTQQFKEGLQSLALSDAAPPLFSEEYALIRELAFSQVTDVISADDDCVRLGIALAMSATSKQLLSAGLAFAARAVTGSDPFSTTDGNGFSADTQAALSLIGIPEPAVTNVYSALDRCFKSLFRVISALDRSTFAGTLSVDASNEQSR